MRHYYLCIDAGISLPLHRVITPLSIPCSETGAARLVKADRADYFRSAMRKPLNEGSLIDFKDYFDFFPDLSRSVTVVLGRLLASAGFT